ncbi:MAG: T9SS type A sorting domain-containing protein [Saprospiraceae bacterium]
MFCLDDASILFNPLNSNDEFYLQVAGNQANDMGYCGHDELSLGLSLLFKKSPALEQSWAPINYFSLYPNPAQHSVTLRWELLEDAEVRIVVTDATGRQLHTLLDGHLSAGPQLTQHALAPMHSGLHFVQILTNGALQYTAKLLVL